MKLEQELFKQRKRLADAERSMQAKPTKAAEESLRIAHNKIDAARRRLGALQRTELLDRDSRIFPGNYAPVLVVEDGRRVIKPMRYLCRPHGTPADFDRKFPGTYNARLARAEPEHLTAMVPDAAPKAYSSASAMSSAIVISIERASNTDNGNHSWVLQAALDAAHVGAVDSAAVCQFLLGHAAFASGAPDRRAQRDQRWIARMLRRRDWHIEMVSI